MKNEDNMVQEDSWDAILTGNKRSFLSTNLLQAGEDRKEFSEDRNEYLEDRKEYLEDRKEYSEDRKAYPENTEESQDWTKIEEKGLAVLLYFQFQTFKFQESQKFSLQILAARIGLNFSFYLK